MRALLRRDRLEAEMDAELCCHVEQRTADLVKAGVDAETAARRARVELGPALKHKEGMRASLGLKAWDELRADFRYGVRILIKSPGFTGIATLSLALAIGANTTLFSVAKRLLLDRLAVPQAEQLRLLRWVGDRHTAVSNVWGVPDDIRDGIGAASFSYPAYEQLRRNNRVLDDLFAYKDVGRL